MGEETIYLDEANFYLRSDQYYYEMMYSYMYGTSDIWNMEVSTGVTNDRLPHTVCQRILCHNLNHALTVHVNPL
mgnify:CR=1 FL=1